MDPCSIESYNSVNVVTFLKKEIATLLNVVVDNGKEENH
jgi:hypothetical protein